jgi:acylphosphatase
MKLHIKIEITGKVQGVWFRKSTKDKADDLGIFGFVENCENGSVYIEAEGELDTLESFVQWCHEGPTHAQVKDVVLLQYEQLQNFESFDIR